MADQGDRRGRLPRLPGRRKDKKEQSQPGLGGAPAFGGGPPGGGQQPAGQQQSGGGRLSGLTGRFGFGRGKKDDQQQGKETAFCASVFHGIIQA